MQSLWSRASQATSRCGCRTCATVARSAGQRVTPPRRKATFVDVFTAAYATIFASAALADSAVKEKRNRQLERQIEGAKRDLAALKQQNDLSEHQRNELEVEESLAWLTDDQMDLLWKTLKSGQPWRWGNQNDSPLLRRSALRQQLQESHYNCSGSSLPTFWDEQEQEQIDRATSYETTKPPANQRNPQTSQHSDELAIDVRFLVERMIKEAKRASSFGETRPAPSPSMREVERMLAEQRYPWFQETSTNPEEARTNVQNLNRACRSAILKTNLGLQERVGRVCYNLLVSKYHPDMTTLNTLVSSFNRLDQLRPLSGVIQRATLDLFAFMPTPVTFAASLHSCRSRGDASHFKHLIKCIVGEDGITGAKYMRRHVSALRLDPALRKWATQTHLRTRTGDFIYDHAPLNPLMVQQILHGLLSFGRLGSCVSFLMSCIVGQVPVTSQMLRSIINECVVTLDWKSAQDLVHHMVHHGQLWWRMISGRDSNSISYLIDRMYSIMDMIGLGDSADFASERWLAQLGISRDGLAAFFASLDETNVALTPEERVRRERGSTGMEDAERGSRSRTLQIESLDKELFRLSMRTTRLDKSLCALNLPLPAQLLIDNSNMELARAQTLGNEAVDLLDALQNTRKTSKLRVHREPLRQGPVPYWAEMSSQQKLSLDTSDFAASLEWQVDLTRPMYRETAAATNTKVLPAWITCKQMSEGKATMREEEQEVAKEQRHLASQGPKPSKTSQAPLKRTAKREQIAAQARIVNPSVLLLDQLEVQMRSQRRAEY